jgi:hypothetical protein
MHSQYNFSVFEEIIENIDQTRSSSLTKKYSDV